MLRTKLRNQFLEKRTSEAKLKYNKQRNRCDSWIRKAKRNDCKSLDLNDVNDNKKFWITVKTLCCNKIKSSDCNGIWTQNHLVRKRALNHLTKPAKNCSVWLNGWVFVYELSVCGFKSRCSYLNFKYRGCFKQRVPWISGNYRV